MTREELIAALEATTGPSRELDWGIHEWIWGVTAPRINRMQPPTYTSSLDAALTLVPEGWASGSIAEERRVIGYVHNNQPAFIGVGACDNPAKIWHEVRHPGRAIALCIAALKARAT